MKHNTCTVAWLLAKHLRMVLIPIKSRLENQLQCFYRFSANKCFQYPEVGNIKVVTIMTLQAQCCPLTPVCQAGRTMQAFYAGCMSHLISAKSLMVVIGSPHTICHAILWYTTTQLHSLNPDHRVNLKRIIFKNSVLACCQELISKYCFLAFEHKHNDPGHQFIFELID